MIPKSSEVDKITSQHWDDLMKDIYDRFRGRQEEHKAKNNIRLRVLGAMSG